MEASGADTTVTPETPVRFYSTTQISWGCFLGGPLAGCWYLSRNQKILGDEGHAFRTMLTGLVGTAVMCVGVMFLPKDFPGIVIPGAYTALFDSIARTTQKDKLAALTAAGGKEYSGWKVTFLSLVWLALTVALMFIVILILSRAFPGFLPEPQK